MMRQTFHRALGHTWWLTRKNLKDVRVCSIRSMPTEGFLDPSALGWMYEHFESTCLLDAGCGQTCGAWDSIPSRRCCVPIDVAPAEMLCSARMHTPSFASSRGALHSSSGLDIAMDGSQSQSSSTSIFFRLLLCSPFYFHPRTLPPILLLRRAAWLREATVAIPQPHCSSRVRSNKHRRILPTHQKEPRGQPPRRLE